MRTQPIAKIVFIIVIFAVVIGIGAVYMKFSSPLSPAVSTNEQPSVAAPAANQSTAPQSCVITIDKLQYDVASLRKTHKGGDIFQCGTDMSDAFHKQHKDNLQMIQKYLLK